MPRIIGVDIPERKPLKIALRYIYGIGPHIALEICKRCNLDPDLRVNNLTEADIGTLNSAITDGFMVEGDLRRQVAQNIRRLTSINCYRGMRHRRPTASGPVYCDNGYVAFSWKHATPSGTPFRRRRTLFTRASTSRSLPKTL